MQRSVVAAAATFDADRDWVLRPFNRETDEDGLYYCLGVAYSRSGAGRRAGATRAGWRSSDEVTPVPEAETIAKQRAFLEAHRPVWNWLLENAEVTLAVDRKCPDDSIWGWLVTSGADVLHALGVKRDMIKAGFGEEIARDLLGDRMQRFQVTTLELPQLRANRVGWKPSSEAIGFDRPKVWGLDPTWLLTRMCVR